ncbi:MULTISPECIES: phosphotransferase [Bacillus]|uniref:Thiamine kinase-like enzyme n=1 Tax=Bacillus capparidis TaxID=1840411 RepID=A0ABS4CYG9_9BACI|nr:MULTISPECIES: phosphotransferase [Bacillus]MBP1082400.1 thiamine kinase-like enzyme [Bacillus capparidis]MED1097344.1 phosphotransferase [Bacillus capparidis]
MKGKISVPFLTKNGEYKWEDDDGIYLLYEYIDGVTIGDQALTEDQVCQLSEIITELHLFGEEIPIHTNSVKEDFYVPFLQQLRNTLDKDYGDIPNDVREIVAPPHIEQINHLIDTVEKLSLCLKNSHLRMVLYHTDLHNWNLMQSEQQLILIDWEGLKLAPVEADLMFLIDKPYYDIFSSIYQKSHKNYKINSNAMQFYKGRRKLEDIWEFIEQLSFDKQDTQERARIINYLIEELNDV